MVSGDEHEVAQVQHNFKEVIFVCLGFEDQEAIWHNI